MNERRRPETATIAFAEVLRQRGVMPQENSLERLAQLGIVPVITSDLGDKALAVADALLAGGLPIIEITFRNSAAAETIRMLTRERPQLMVGAGTILSSDDLQAAIASGAVFGVAPGLNPQIVKQAGELGLPFIPGVATPSEIELGLTLGCRLLKFFPAEALGGAPMLDALSAPFKHTGVRFMPSGGLTAGNVGNYLKLGSVTAAGGTWITRTEDIAANNWQEIRWRAKSATQIVAGARG